MKTPIEPKDVRAGDLVRNERSGADADVYSAVEYVADHDGDSTMAGQYYLLDRPTPPVELPKTPTLGWLTTANGELRCGHVRIDSDPRWVYEDDHGLHVEAVTAFVPATAVPTAALDKFRHLRETRNLTNGDIDTFLAAIDEAANT